MKNKTAVLFVAEGNCYKEAKKLYHVFKNKYNSKGNFWFAHPHISLRSGFPINIEGLVREIKELSKAIRPFEIVVDSWGTFEGKENAFFMEVKKDRKLSSVQKKVNAIVHKNCRVLDKIGEPKTWHPHITLAFRDLTKRNLEKAKEDFRDYHPKFRFKVHYIYLVKQLGPDKWGVWKKIGLGE